MILLKNIQTRWAHWKWCRKLIRTGFVLLCVFLGFGLFVALAEAFFSHLIIFSLLWVLLPLIAWYYALGFGTPLTIQQFQVARGILTTVAGLVSVFHTMAVVVRGDPTAIPWYETIWVYLFQWLIIGLILGIPYLTWTGFKRAERDLINREWLRSRSKL